MVGRQKRKPEGLEVETDPRFPSGRWVGFWLQRQMPGRQYMSLALTFADGRLVGTGSDRVGDFSLAGEYDLPTGGCRMLKIYQGAHSVTYAGRNEGDGHWLWGLWDIRGLDRGGFHLWPEGEDDPTGRTLKQERELPRAEPRVLMPAF